MMMIVLVASIVALVALMLAAAPAFAQSDRACDPGNASFCDEDDDNDDGDDNGDDDDGDDNVINSNDRFRFNNVGNLEVSPTFEASQETEQDCDTGDVSQPISVDSSGDNSVTTVGLNPSANTGCAQTALGVLDFDPTLAVQGGDFAFNADQFTVIQDNDCDGEDDDGDGRHDEDNFNCDDNGDDNGNHDGNHADDNGDDNGDNIVDINDRDSFRFGGDRQIVNGGGGDGFDLDIDDFGSSISMDGGGTTIGGGEVNQAASAASTTTQVFPWWFPLKKRAARELASAARAMHEGRGF
jgi:hypothetical protein